MPRFSLILATIGRTHELRQFLAHLAMQDFDDYELLIMDQNEDDRVAIILAEYRSVLKAVIVHSPKGLSRARNLGLSLANGELLAFPDDDCWYPDGLLKNVSSWFCQEPKYSILSVGAVDESGQPSGNRWIQSRCDIAAVNAFRTTFSSTLFIKRTDDVLNVHFDENLGLGSKSAVGGEETDFILQLLKKGLRGRFDRRWVIVHPRRDLLSGSVQADRAMRYGTGTGRILRKHTLVFPWFSLIVYGFARWSLILVSGRLGAATLCWAHLRGLFMGFVMISRVPTVFGSDRERTTHEKDHTSD